MSSILIWFSIDAFLREKKCWKCSNNLPLNISCILLIEDFIFVHLEDIHVPQFYYSANWVGLQNTLISTLQMGNTPSPLSVLDMTRTIRKSLQSWSFGECSLLLHCHYSKVHYCTKWLYRLWLNNGLNRTVKSFNCVQTNKCC